MRIMAMMAVLAMVPMAVGVAQAKDSVPAADASSQAVTAPVTDVPGVDCSAVADWTMLSQCVSKTRTGGLVTITATVTVPDRAQAAISKPITLTATTGEKTSIAALKHGDTFLTVGQGGSLTIGKDKDDAGFSYKDGKRYFAYVAQGGSLTINNGVFSGIDVTGDNYREGAVAYNAGGTVSVNGGTFSGNTAVNGGVINQISGTTTIKGGTFSDNTATTSGGAIYSKGTLIVQGGATFSGNRAQGNNVGVFDNGGGAIWAQGKLYVKNGLTGLRPMFDGNQALTDQLGTDGKLGKGGAGGAIFVMSDSTAYLTGGTFKNNLSGYLGGAIYTEEKSTTYVGKSVAYGNTAGHFGGGLWFCPSGNSTASKGGNIALFDNKTDPGIDGNTDPDDPDSNNVKHIPTGSGADSTQAGADLAIMNPYWKWVNGWMNGISTNQFQLLDTWFTNRSEQAVTWYWDNVPLQHSSGYHDSWLPTSQKKNQGIEAILATSKDPKNNTVQAPGLLQLQANDKEPGDQWIRTGVALKTTVKNEGYKTEAQQKAQITMTGNQARLSGGAFGSNGVVVFDSPYSMNWNKVDEQGNEVDTASTWELSTNMLASPYTSPYLDEDMRPTDCQSGGAADGCWAQDNGTWSVDIVDNGPRDNDPSFGGISLDNLAPGTYTLQEKTPPTGYQKTDETYTFTIVAAESGGTPKPVELKDSSGKTVTDSAIVNHPVTGMLAWSKTDADNTRIAGSVWTITKPDNTTVDVADRTATDNQTSLDEDNGDGDFRISLFKDKKPDPAWPDGKYTLQEKTPPSGYWKTGATYSFTITTQDSGNRAAAWNDKDVTGQFTNKPTIVSWSKVSADNTDQPLPGAEWTITKLDANGNPTGSPWTVSDCSPEACSTPQGGLKDSDATAGGFTVKSLEPGSYQLEEKTAPEGYAKTDTKYTFTIGDTEGNVTISVKNGSTGEAVKDNRIVNHAIVTALPFTGGRDTRDWYIIGGGIALLGLAVAVAYQRMKRNTNF